MFLHQDLGSEPLHGVIMAGGRGTRLLPLTLNRPKPMVEVLGRPVLDYVKDAMVAAGIEDIIVTTGFQGEVMSKHVDSWNSEVVNASINQEYTPMGTAGSVRLLSERLTQTFVLGSGDSVASFDIAELLRLHKEKGAMVTMALWQVEDPCEYGIVGLSSSPGGEVDGELKQGYISRFKEKPSPEEAFSNVINAGLYIIEPEVLQMVPEGEKYDFSKQLFPRVLELGMPMYAKTVEGIWYDVGHPLELLNAQRALIEMRESLPFPMPEGEVLSDGSFVSKGSTVLGNIERSVILSNCHISAESSVKDSLIMSGCNVAGNISGSVIGESCIVKDSNLREMVIGDQQNIQSEDLSNHRLPVNEQSE